MKRARTLIDFYHKSSAMHKYSFAVGSEPTWRELKWEEEKCPKDLNHIRAIYSAYNTEIGYHFI